MGSLLLSVKKQNKTRILQINIISHLQGGDIWDGHVVTKSDRRVFFGNFGFLPYEDHTNANIGANEHD